MASRTQAELYQEWKSLVNMSASELRRFMDSPEGRTAGLSQSEARKQGIKSGRDSARAILRMKERTKAHWTDADWAWAKRQVGFIKRMSGSKGKLRDAQGEPTRKLIALKIWGHDPEKLKKNRRVQTPRRSVRFIAEDVVQSVSRKLQQWMGEWKHVQGKPIEEEPLASFPQDILGKQYPIDGMIISVLVRRVWSPAADWVADGVMELTNRGTVTITLGLNSKYPIGLFADTEGPYAEELESVLQHEMTHAFDPALREQLRQRRSSERMGPVGDADYINRPAEVKAFGQQVIIEARRNYQRYAAKLPENQAFRQVVTNTPTWWNWVKHMTHENQQRILRDAYQDFTQEGW